MSIFQQPIDTYFAQHPEQAENLQQPASQPQAEETTAKPPEVKVKRLWLPCAKEQLRA